MALSRRYFFFGSVLAGAIPKGGFGSTPSLKAAGYKSPNEKLNIGSIGAAGKAASDIDGCAHTENIVALCDVDDQNVAKAKTYEKYEKATKYKDFRKMLDKEGSNIDAMIVTIPDFMHATAALWCMERGKHVYVQKPLAHTITEARMLNDAATRYKVATQMGNQGYSNEGTRQCAEMIWSGEIGNVTEVHAWTDRPWWPQGLTEIPAPNPVPSTLDWDLWLGKANPRPFTIGGEGYPNQYGNFYQPFNWRGFFDFGCGALGDMACHILGAPNMALKLTERAPTSVECVEKEGASSFMYPKRSLIRFDFPAYANMPALKLFWHDGMKENPKIAGVPDGEWLGDLPRIRRPQPQAGAPAQQAHPPVHPPEQIIGSVFNYEAFMARKTEGEMAPNQQPNGSVFIGDKGIITTGTYGENTRLIPVEKMKDYKFPPELLTRSPGHYRDWIRACKGGDPACSNFSVAAPMTEWILLGTIALRVEGKLDWDSAHMRITNNQEANKYVKPFIRKGWQMT
ncbi:MAG TPA: Gfo/Idh/MocA family oxidoreductase [Bryobacteraceae bacterium]|jgi:predicted dehydrogenase|nr:Gfo/Idh/MocA family oxidoreductase [Bryobacteraceae bacterium]